MVLTEKIKIIFNYIILFIKKQYRISFAKKLSYLSDEFNYLSKDICIFLSKVFSWGEVIFNLILPITVVFCPIYLKYLAVSILFITYLTKMKELKVRSIRMYFHKLFIKDAVFQLYGIVLSYLSLIIIFDIKAIVVLILIVIFSFVNVPYISNLYLYLYGIIYLFATIYILKSYIYFFTILYIFLTMIMIIYIYRKKVLINRNYSFSLKKICIFNINLKKLIRKLCGNKQEFVSFIFPFYIIIFFIVCYILERIPLSLNTQLRDIIKLCIYFIMYYGYTKLRALKHDEFFYFATTKIEFLSLNTIFNYIQKIFSTVIFSVFSIFWGTIYLISSCKLKYSLKIILMIILSHIFILIICTSANIYVDKNKLDVTKQPEDIRRYMSFIEALFLSSMLVIISLFMNLSFNEGVTKDLVDTLVNINVAISIIQLIVLIGAIFSIIKTINYIFIVKINIQRRR